MRPFSRGRAGDFEMFQPRDLPFFQPIRPNGSIYQFFACFCQDVAQTFSCLKLFCALALCCLQKSWICAAETKISRVNHQLATDAALHVAGGQRAALDNFDGAAGGELRSSQIMFLHAKPLGDIVPKWGSVDPFTCSTGERRDKLQDEMCSKLDAIKKINNWRLQRGLLTGDCEKPHTFQTSRLSAHASSSHLDLHLFWISSASELVAWANSWSICGGPAVGDCEGRGFDQPECCWVG